MTNLQGEAVSNSSTRRRHPSEGNPNPLRRSSHGTTSISNSHNVVQDVRTDVQLRRYNDRWSYHSEGASAVYSLQLTKEGNPRRQVWLFDSVGVMNATRK